jgi:osomolarity two-component system phosphorelay intermediate protein YPD1
MATVQQGAEDELAPLQQLEAGALHIDTFSQILEMDEGSDKEFSASIVFDFFDQAEETFKQMDTALDKRDLPELSSLGHFLKGSSATLGMNKVRDGCEKIQQYGKGMDEEGNRVGSEVCLQEIKEAFQQVKDDFAEVEAALRKYYEQFDI